MLGLSFFSGPYCTRMRRSLAWALISSVVAAAVAIVIYVRHRLARRRREPFLPLLPLLGLGLTAAGVGASVTGVDKKVQDKVWAAGGVGEKIPGIGGGGSAKYVPTYSGRRWDGADCSCPDNTIETGLEDARACITSQFHPPMWKPDDKGVWGHNCPNGTTATGEGEWEKKCEAGHTGRVLMDGKWQCPSGTTDTGNNWDKGWREGQKQCKRSRPYGARMWDGKKWSCPPGTKDTGRNWGMTNPADQCKFVGP